MIRANIHEVKTHFSDYLSQVEEGETVLVCKRNIPIAEIRALPVHLYQARPIGLAKDKFEIPDNFFDPLPDEIINSFLHPEE